MNEVLRQEKKYLLTAERAARMQGLMEQVLKQDAHNGAQGYCVRSLYFDTPWDDDYQDKVDGLEVRRKLRLRTYDPAAPFAMLELKQKQGEQQKKRSLMLRREDAERLAGGEYGVLLRYEETFAAECYGLMCTKCYRPKTIVEYRRRAFIAKENRIRVTFDSSMMATECCFDLFSERLALYPVLDPAIVVLEVKYNGFLLDYIKKLTSQADQCAVSVSKYCLARSIGTGYSL